MPLVATVGLRPTFSDLKLRMVVRIRLARWGARNNPFYGIVVANGRRARDGKHIERIGTYNPIPDVHAVKHIALDIPRVTYWLGVGAQPSARVSYLLEKLGMVPKMPRQAHNEGGVNLVDKSTWDVQVRDTSGNVIGVLSGAEAKAKFEGGEMEGQLPLTPKRVTVSMLDVSKLVLDSGKPPAGPLTDADRTLVLKRYLGLA